MEAAWQVAQRSDSSAQSATKKICPRAFNPDSYGASILEENSLTQHGG
jgi:hypothetical protein